MVLDEEKKVHFTVNQFITKLDSGDMLDRALALEPEYTNRKFNCSWLLMSDWAVEHPQSIGNLVDYK